MLQLTPVADKAECAEAIVAVALLVSSRPSYSIAVPRRRGGYIELFVGAIFFLQFVLLVFVALGGRGCCGDGVSVPLVMGLMCGSRYGFW